MKNLSKTLVVLITLLGTQPAFALSKLLYMTCYKEEVFDLQKMLMSNKVPPNSKTEMLGFLSAARMGLDSHDVSVVHDALIRSKTCDEFTKNVAPTKNKHLNRNSGIDQMGHCSFRELPFTQYLFENGIFVQNRIIGENTSDIRNMRRKFEDRSFSCVYLDKEMLKLTIKHLRSSTGASDFFNLFF